jgi:hypothetical protein
MVAEKIRYIERVLYGVSACAQVWRSFCVEACEGANLLASLQGSLPCKPKSL